MMLAAMNTSVHNAIILEMDAEGYRNDRIHVASASASSCDRFACAGIGICPQFPPPPAMMRAAREPIAAGSLAYRAAIKE
jgi:hypothetical protein